MRHLLLPLLLLALASPAAALEFKEWLKASDGSHHQQTEYAPVDPKGDAYLIRKLDQVPMKLLRALLKLDAYQPAADQAKKGKSDRLFALDGERAKAPDKIATSELDRMIRADEAGDLAFGAGDTARGTSLPAPAKAKSARTTIPDDGAKGTLGELDALIARKTASLLGETAPARTPAERFGFLVEERTRSKAGKGEPRPYEIGRTPPFDPDRLVNAFVQVIQSHPEFPLTVSAEHAWSPEAKRYLYYGFWHRLGRFLLRRQKDLPTPLFLRSKFFLLLACGWTTRYAITGNEAALEAKLLARPDRSLRIHDLFEESYLLHRGDLYLSLLCVENVLAGNPYEEDRANKPLQKKLMYIRNDSAPLGDNYGAWYHFYGIALYGLLRPGAVSRAVAEIESLGSLFLEGPDRQEDYVNRYGAIFGMKLRRMVESGAWRTPLPADARVDYMTPGR